MSSADSCGEMRTPPPGCRSCAPLQLLTRGVDTAHAAVYHMHGRLYKPRSAIAIAASVHSTPLARRDVDPALVPDFGVQAGVNPDGTGNCDGIPGPNRKPILIPCSCPPPRDQFIAMRSPPLPRIFPRLLCSSPPPPPLLPQALNANVAAGHMINNPPIAAPFPPGSTKADQQARIATLLSTLQNLNGPGVGCPAASTVYGLLQQEINNLPN